MNNNLIVGRYPKPLAYSKVLCVAGLHDIRPTHDALTDFCNGVSNVQMLSLAPVKGICGPSRYLLKDITTLWYPSHGPFGLVCNPQATDLCSNFEQMWHAPVPFDVIFVGSIMSVQRSIDCAVLLQRPSTFNFEYRATVCDES